MNLTNTQANFCRLTGITEEQYQTILFEYGCLYAETYWKNTLLQNSQKLSKIMLSLSQFWNWWQIQWNIRTQEAFGVVGIDETESVLSETEQCALIESFKDTHNLKTFTYIYPNQWVFKAFKEKLDGNKTINQSASVRIRRTNRNIYTKIKS